MKHRSIQRRLRALVLGSSLLTLGACAATDATDPMAGPPKVVDRGDVRDVTIYTTPDGDAIDVERAARELRDHDVIFLGELHDSLSGHLVMTDLTERILAGHPTPIVSMEMFERDVQDVVTAYVDGFVDRGFLIANARPWNVRIDAETGAVDTTGYDAHYGDVVDLAKERGWDVIAANVPRRDARAIARSENVDTQPSIYASPRSDLSDGRYRRKFESFMGGGHGSSPHGSSPHGAATQASPMYAAQVVKDETMARSIARLFERDGGDWPRVVHWNGRFHSDWGLGTVERLRALHPDLRIAVVSMERGDGRAVARSDDPPADWIIEVP